VPCCWGRQGPGAPALLLGWRQQMQRRRCFLGGLGAAKPGMVGVVVFGCAGKIDANLASLNEAVVMRARASLLHACWAQRREALEEEGGSGAHQA
jgi:hypothetical protein